MPYCPTCSNPTQESWRNCAVCGNQLVEVLNTEQLQAQKAGLGTGAKVAIIAGATTFVAVIGIVAVLLLNRPTTTDSQQPEVSQGELDTKETPKPVSASKAQSVVDRLLEENICTSALSAEEYATAPSLGIGSEYWESGDVRVCRVDRTSNSTTRWVTIITGQSLLQTFGNGWKVEPLSIAIHNAEWTIVTKTILKGDPVRDDPVVQSILVKLGGTYSLPSK